MNYRVNRDNFKEVFEKVKTKYIHLSMMDKKYNQLK